MIIRKKRKQNIGLNKLVREEKKNKYMFLKNDWFDFTKAIYKIGKHWSINNRRLGSSLLSLPLYKKQVMGVIPGSVPERDKMNKIIK